MEIKIEQLKKSFGQKVATDIDNYTIHSGDMLGLVGNNGAGKTTLFRLMLDLLQADQGSVHIGENNVTETKTGKRIPVPLSTMASSSTTSHRKNTSSS